MFDLHPGTGGFDLDFLVALIFGIVVAVLVLIIAIIVIVYCVRKRRRIALGNARFLTRFIALE